nr:hypothetical protein CFP56_00697 [Quercus suber]
MRSGMQRVRAGGKRGTRPPKRGWSDADRLLLRLTTVHMHMYIHRGSAPVYIRYASDMLAPLQATADDQDCFYV